MGDNHSKIVEEMKRLIDKSAFIWFIFMTGLSVLIFLLYILGFLPISALWSLIWLLPTVLALLFAVHYFHKKTDTFAKKQQLAMIAFYVKQAFDVLQPKFWDADISDCDIKLSYLIKNGIQVRKTLKAFNNDGDSYNDLAMRFAEECNHLADDLFHLMRQETLFQYGAKVHDLRIMANKLGIENLADTAYFHELGAYSGNIEIVKTNWDKLSFELDEAYRIFSGYIRSLECAEHDRKKDSAQMTFKKWGEQLQEAFRALEEFDTDKAKQILNELIRYQIDADIIKSLQGIIAAIDEI